MVAEEATKHKSQFLANMSHEIRTPLNAITGFITLLQENETDETKLKYLKIIKNSSDSLVQIINDILDISKIESGKLKIEPYNFNPYENLITIAELFQAKAAEKKIEFKIKYNNDMPKILYGDALRIKQIFTNLLSNAIKFTPEGSVVKCVVWYKNGELSILVKDYGIGISEEKQKTIFEPFTQADGSTERVYGGTGLGLTISLELSRMLGGTLKLKSKEGKGSTFKLTVPLPLGEEEDQCDYNEELSPLGHILIVEDYEAYRMFLSIILENAGLTYEMAHDGIEAIEKFKSGKYDLILMDENMPNLGGIAATKEILKIEREKSLSHTPLISLTANALQGDRERFLEAGFDDYLTKPIDPDLLLKTMSRLLKKN
jgi:CheY-like chemotaxis protein